MAGVTRTGAWARARAGFRGGGKKFAGAIDKALLAEAHELRKEIVLQIRSQEGFVALSPWTVAKRKLLRRGGTKALIQRGDLLGSIGVVKAGDEVFVGVPRSVANGEKLVRLAEVHEFGTDPIIIPITPGMRRIIALIAKKLGRNTGTRGAGSGAIVVQIPARPFIRPAFERWKIGVRERMIRRIAENMGWA